MAKLTFGDVVAFAPQTAEGTFDTVLDGITTVLRGQRVPGGADVDDGLLLGDPGSGIRQSGLTFQVQRVHADKGVVAGSFTKPLSDWLRADVQSFQFAFPFCGHRANVQAVPADADFRPLRGIDALLQGAGLVGAAWGAGVGWQFLFASPFSISSLIYYGGTGAAEMSRLELLDCKVETLAITWKAGQIPVAVATLRVGSIKDPTATPVTPVTIPSTLNYGEQATVSAPKAVSVAHTWQNARGFDELTLTIKNTVEEIGDANLASGVVKEQTERIVTLDATLYADSADDAYDLGQAFVQSTGDLDALSFTVGTAAGASQPAKAVYISLPSPELDNFNVANLGSKAAASVSLIARAATANTELELRFI